MDSSDSCMKLHLEQAAGCRVFTGYGDGYVAVNEVRHDNPVVVTADTLTPWEVATFETLAVDHFSSLLAFSPEIVLLGTGARLRFPPPALTQPLTAARVGIEVMTRALPVALLMCELRGPQGPGRVSSNRPSKPYRGTGLQIGKSIGWTARCAPKHER